MSNLLRRSSVLLVLLGCAFAQEGRIAFVTPSGELATLDPQEGEARILSSGEKRHQFPAWSPQDETIAVIGADAAGSFVQVYRDEAGATPQELYRSPNEAPIYLYWSPDGETVSFLASDSQTALALRLAPLGGEPYVLAGGQPFYWQWRADSGGLLLHIGFAGEEARLGFSDAGSDTLRENLAPPGRFQAPGIAPSGDYFAYAEVAFGGRGRLVVQSRDAEAPVTRQLFHEGLVALGWSPADDRLAFISPPESAPHFYGPLRLLEAETGLLETVTDDPVLAFFWSPDGRHLAYLRPSSGAGQDVAAAGALRRVQQGLPVLELWLYDLDGGEGRLLTPFVPSPLFLTQFLPFFDQYALSHRLWSRDSRALALPVVTEGGVNVAVVTLEGEVSLLGAGDMPFWSQR